MAEGQSGGKDRQASFPTKRPLEKLVKKRNPHRQDSSVAAWSPYCRCGSSRPFRDCSWKRHSLAEAREPTSLARRCWSSGGVRHRPALSPKWHGPTRVVQRHLAGPPCGSQAPLPSFQSSGRPGFPVRVGCSRTVMVPRWVLVPLVFQRPSFEDRLSSLDLRSSLRPNASSKLSQQTAVCWRQGISQKITLRSRRTVVRGAGQPFLANQVGWQPVSFVSPPKRPFERTVGVAV